MSRRVARAAAPPPERESELILATEDTSLLDLVDNVLNKGVVLTGDITLGLAQVELVYARLSVLLCAADRVMPPESTDFLERHSARHAMRDRRARRNEDARAPRGAGREDARARRSAAPESTRKPPRP